MTGMLAQIMLQRDMKENGMLLFTLVDNAGIISYWPSMVVLLHYREGQ